MGGSGGWVGVWFFFFLSFASLLALESDFASVHVCGVCVCVPVCDRKEGARACAGVAAWILPACPALPSCFPTPPRPAQDLIKKMLQADPEKRMSIEEALRHPWINAPDSVASRVHRQGTIDELRRFNARRKIKVGPALGCYLRMTEAQCRSAPDVFEPRQAEACPWLFATPLRATMCFMGSPRCRRRPSRAVL